jgi:Ran GTPase-activating protein (RanGAP) involved in mRNA processing and transport
MLRNCENYKIYFIDLSYNFLDHDGGKAFNEFLWTNSHLRTLKLTGCKCSKRTAELLLESWEENNNLKITEMHLNGNLFDEKSMKVLAKFFANMNSIEYLDIAENVSDPNSKALKLLLEGLNECK